MHDEHLGLKVLCMTSTNLNFQCTYIKPNEEHTGKCSHKNSIRSIEETTLSTAPSYPPISTNSTITNDKSSPVIGNKK